MRVLVQEVWHVEHKRVALKVIRLQDPIAALLTLVGVLHQGVRAAATQVQAVVSEARVTLAHGDLSILVADTMAVAVDGATQVSTERIPLAEAIVVPVVTCFALGAVSAREVRVALAEVRAITWFNALEGALYVTVAGRRAYLHVVRVGLLWRHHLRDALVLPRRVIVEH